MRCSAVRSKQQRAIFKIMVRIINGRFHQGQICSQAAGYQCTAIALAVILFTVGYLSCVKSAKLVCKYS